MSELQECIVTSLLSQKKEIKRQQALLEKMKVEEEQEREQAREQARQRVLEDFERTQSGVGSSGSRTAVSATGRPIGNNASTTVSTSTVEPGSERGVKRKFELDDSEVASLAKEQEDKALKQIEREQAEKRKAKLPNFWIPANTPEAAPTKISEVKLQTLCHAGDPAHPVR